MGIFTSYVTLKRNPSKVICANYMCYLFDFFAQLQSPVNTESRVTAENIKGVFHCNDWISFYVRSLTEYFQFKKSKFAAKKKYSVPKGKSDCVVHVFERDSSSVFLFVGS